MLIGCSNRQDEQLGFRGETETEGHESSGSMSTGVLESSSAGESTTHDVGTTDCTESGSTGDTEGCVRTQGYWKNHSVHAKQPHKQLAWPIAEDTEICDGSWYEWLWMPPRGDAWIILAHQWIAASLNVAAGASVPAEVQTALTDGQALLEGCAITADDRQAATDLASLLDAYNNGQSGGPGHCD